MTKSTSTIPNPARSPAQARANIAGKIPAYLDRLNVQLDEGLRLFALPAGAAAPLAAALREQGWTVQVSGGKPGEKALLLSHPDDTDASEEG